MKFDFRFTLAYLLILGITLVAPIGFAQEIEYLDDEGTSLWEEEQFLDVTGQEFETEDHQYVGEEEVQAAEEAAKKVGVPGVNLVAAIEQDKKLLPDNILYGVGTGALIGGWWALTQGKDSRTNISYVTMGVLGGALLGVAVGAKSIYIGPKSQISFKIDSMPATKSDQNRILQADQKYNVNKSFSPHARIDFQFKF